jgi:hypothetical protein
MTLPSHLPAPDTSRDEDEIEASRAPLIEHLIELRTRLIYSLWSFGIAFAICYYFAGHIYDFLVEPFAREVSGQTGRRLIYTAPQEAFFTQIKVALYAAVWFAAAPLAAHAENPQLVPIMRGARLSPGWSPTFGLVCNTDIGGMFAVNGTDGYSQAALGSQLTLQ